jgi:hypothetical protein
MSEKVLVFTPMHPQPPHLYDRCASALVGLEHSGPLEYWLRKGDNPWSTGNGVTDVRLNVLHQYERAREAALQHGFDYLLTVEYDNVPPPDAIARLLACDADVAYGLYVFRARSRWSAFTELSSSKGASLSENPELAREMWGKHFPSYGCGFGTTLISRRVLENVPFRGFAGAANDWYFAIDLQEGGYKQIHDLGCLVGHIDNKPLQRIIWPDITMPGLYRNEFLGKIPVGPDGTFELVIDRVGEFTITAQDLENM